MNTEDNDFFDEEDEENTGQLSLTDLYNRLLIDNELIVTVPVEEESKVRKGLAVIKAKKNKQLKEAGLPVDDASFSFTVTANKKIEGAIDIHIVLAKRTTITVLGVKKPDDTL